MAHLRPKQKVLIVDDTPANIMVLMETLKSEYAIVTAIKGERALEIAKKAPQPDIILLDIMMPGMNGYQVCEQLKANRTTADIPVVFVTAMTDAGDEQKGLELGAVDYITKPFQPDLVKARVKNHLALASARKELVRQNEILRENQRLREEVERIARHDVKSPLNVILAFPELIRMEGNLSEDQLEMLSDIEEAGSQALNLINRSLDLYKMETGVYPYEPQAVALLQILDRAVRDAGSYIRSKNLAVEFFMDNAPRSPSDDFSVQGEGLLCLSLFGNLITNAAEAAPESSVISLFLTKKEDVGEVVVQNKGEIPAHVQDRFFEKYVTHGKKRGTGLGTYSAMLMTKTMKGSIHLEASDGLVRVRVRLPVC